jgi:hypothetical protein
MKKVFIGLFLILCFAFIGCKSATETEAKNFIDVSSYLKGQLAYLDTVPYAFLKLTLKDTLYSDSVYLTKKEVNEIISLFLVKELEKKEFEKGFNETTFLDGTINTLTLTYQPKNTIEIIQRVDIYVNPETEQIAKIYIVRKKDLVSQQLLWKHNSSFTLITTTMDKQNNQEVKTEKVIWNE